MRAWIAVALVASIMLAGCGDKDEMSDNEMGQIVDDAISRLATDIGPGGAISGADLSIPVDAGFAIIPVPLTLTIGPDGDMRIDGSFGNPLGGEKVTVVAYCNPERLIVITSGLETISEGSEDFSIESRNSVGSCIEFDGTVAELLGGFGGLSDLIDNDGRLERTGLKQISKNAVEAVYLDQATDAVLTLSVEDERLSRVAAATDGQELSVAFTYGLRSQLVIPEAAEKIGAGVDWSLEKGTYEGDPGILTINSGTRNITDYYIRVYPRAGSIPCSGGDAPLTQFNMSLGLRQDQDGFTMDYRDDGDSLMDKGDRAFFWGPDKLEEPWRYKVEVWDVWSDSSADPVCSIPAPPAIYGVAGLLIAAALVRRRS